MTLESVYDVHRAPIGQFTLISRHPDEKMADFSRGLISAWTCRLQHVFADYWTLEDCFLQSSFLYIDFTKNAVGNKIPMAASSKANNRAGPIGSRSPNPIDSNVTPLK